MTDQNNDDAMVAAILRRLGRHGPMTVSTAADLLGLPGPWTLRRLEARGDVPSSRRALATGHRYYSADDIARLRADLVSQRMGSKERTK